MSGKGSRSGYCYTCGKQFKNAHGLSVHKAKMHREKSIRDNPDDCADEWDENSYCYKCHRQFKNAHGLSIHEGQMHCETIASRVYDTSREQLKYGRNTIKYDADYREKWEEVGYPHEDDRDFKNPNWPTDEATTLRENLSPSSPYYKPSREKWEEVGYPHEYDRDFENPNWPTDEGRPTDLSPSSPYYKPSKGERNEDLQRDREFEKDHESCRPAYGARTHQKLSNCTSKDAVDELYRSTWNAKVEKSRQFSSVGAGSKDPTKARSSYLRHIERVQIIARDEIRNIPTAVQGGLDYGGLKEAFAECAKVHFIFCDLVEKLGFMKEAWKSFLDTVCELYDNLIAWRELHFWPPQRNRLKDQANPRSHRAASGNCTICPSFDAIRSDFTDTRGDGQLKYKLHHSPDESEYYCKVQNVIYVITCKGDCGRCKKRYVGKTKNSLKGRYPSGSKAKECAHFKEPGHSENFRILQVVDEASLFPDNDSFVDYVRGNPVNTRGVEKLWIDRLIGDGDLNTQKEFNRSDDHRRHMSELLRFFICKHEVKYIVAHEKQSDIPHLDLLNWW